MLYIFLGGQVFTGHLIISKLWCKVPVIGFDACLTSLMFHFFSSRLYRCLYQKDHG